MTEQKQLFYRPNGDEHASLVATVYAPKVEPGSGRVSEVYLDGIKVLFAAARAPALSLGADVRLALADRGTDTSVNLGARLVERRDVGQRRELVFTFRSAEEIRRKLPLGLYALLNRRRDVRLRLRQPVPIEIAPTDAGEASPWLAGELVSMSASGVGLRTSAPNEAQLTDVARYRVRLFPLLGEQGEQAEQAEQLVSFVVAPRNARLDSDGRVHYGCEFVAERPGEHDFERVLDAIFNCPYEDCCGAIAPTGCTHAPPNSGVRSRSNLD